MNFIVGFGRKTYIANVKRIETVKLPTDEMANYFETKYQIDLFEDNNYMFTSYCQMQYDEKPDVIDVATAISEHFNRFILTFAKYGKLQ